MAVTGWLKLNKNPLGANISSDFSISRIREIKVNLYNSESPDTLKSLFYIVDLSPFGLVVVPSDNRIEPVSLFSDKSINDISDNNPLIILLKNHFSALFEQISINEKLSINEKISTPDITDSFQTPVDQVENKWQMLLYMGSKTGDVEMQQLANLDDLRAGPLVQTSWSQGAAGGADVFNRFTPSNYPCGCVATSMAQIMKFHGFPDSSVGTASFSITSDGTASTVSLLGGDGAGNAYNWSLVPLNPDASTSEAARDMLGRICADAGATVNMSYTASASSTDTLKAAQALKSTFKFSNASTLYNWGSQLGPDLNVVLNTNLDAGLPVILGVSRAVSGHAIICDGYGYNTGTMYHHLNMGWNDSGSNDVWYNLPDIDAAIVYDTVTKAVYNIFKNGSGQIISGRVTDKSGNPISGASVTADSGGTTYNGVTNAKGIYALWPLLPNKTYTLTASFGTEVFSDISVTIGQDSQLDTANKWAQDFQAQGSISGPQISSYTLAGDNSYTDIVFSEPVYSNNNATGALQVSDLTIIFSQNGGNTTGISMSSLTDTSGSALTGGETAIRVNISLSGTPAGTETFEIKPASGSALFDASGTAMSDTQTTGQISLNAEYIPATVSSVTSDTPNGEYGRGSVIRLKVIFNVAVNITGAPRIALETGPDDGYAVYVSGSGSKTIYFDYTVQPGHSSNDLAYKGTDALELNSGTIKALTGQDADPTLPVTGSSTSLSGSKAIKIETTAPKITDVNSSSGDNLFGPGQSVLITVTFDETVTVTTDSGMPSIALETGATDREAYYESGSSSTQLVFKYTVQFNDHSDDLAYKGTDALTLNGGTIKDSAGNSAVLTLPAPGTPNSLSYSRSIRIDGSSGSVVSVRASALQGAYRASQTVDIIIKFSEIVTVTDTPLLNLETGPDDGQAFYQSGSGTNELVFRYTVIQGHNSLDLTYRDTGSLNLNNGAIKDLASNNVITTLPFPGAENSLSHTSDIIIDTVLPLISSLTETPKQDILKIVFSEPVYSGPDKTGGLEKEDLVITIYPNGGSATQISIVSLKTETGLLPQGGESVLLAETELNSVPSGVETVSLKASAGAVFDIAGNEMNSNTASPILKLTGRVLFVNADAQGTNDGSSWENAVTDLNYALNLKLDNREIWVAKGTYTPFNGQDRTKSIVIPAGAHVFGGFKGTELKKQERSWQNYPSLLSGDIGVPGTAADNSYHVVMMMENSEINGFIIENGYADGPLQTDKSGGGLISLKMGITIENIVFKNNYALSRGGALYIEAADPTVRSCFFTQNQSADYGGGLAFFNDYSGIIEKCMFLENNAVRGGGAALLFSPVTLENCAFANNIASLNGHELMCQSYGPSLVNCTFYTEHIQISPVYLLNSDMKIINTIISCPNKAVNCSSSAPTAQNSLISNTGSSAAWTGTPVLDLGGNLDENPLFINNQSITGPDNIPATSDDGLILSALSPCIDKAQTLKAPSSDIKNTPRPADAGPDMGCYEGQAGTIVSVVSVSSISPDKAYRAGDDIDIQINFSNVVTVTKTPAVKLNSGPAARALYFEGSGTNTLKFRYRVLQGDSTESLATAGTLSLVTPDSTISSAEGIINLTLPAEGQANSFSESCTIVIDTSDPAIFSLSLSSDNLWGTISFSEGIFGNFQADTPIGPDDLNFIFTPQNGSTCEITVLSLTKTDDTPLLGNEIEVKFNLLVTGQVNGSETLEVKSKSDSIYDRSGNPLAPMMSAGTVTFTSPDAPYVVSVTTGALNMAYGTGSVIPISVNFSQPVTVTGEPVLIINAGTQDVQALLAAPAADTQTVTFNYTVLKGHFSNDLSYVSTGSLKPGSLSSITGNTGINAATGLPEPGSPQSLSGGADIIIETEAPFITSSSLSANNQTVTIQFSEPVYSNSGGPLSKDYFSVIFDKNKGTVLNVEITDIFNSSNGPVTGGENIIKVNLRINGAVAGTEKLSISTLESPLIRDLAGNPAESVLPDQGLPKTDVFYLFPGPGNSQPWISPEIPVLYAQTGQPLIIDLSNFENDNEDGSDSPLLKWYTSASDKLTVTGQGSDNDILTVSSVSGLPGRYEIELILKDSSGLESRQKTDIIWLDSSGSPVSGLSITSNLSAYPGYPLEDLLDNTSLFQQDFAAIMALGTQPVIEIDLKKDYIISGLTIINDGQYGAKSAVLSSATQTGGAEELKQTAIFSAFDTTPNQCNPCVFSVQTFKARYLKLLFDKTADPVWFQLNEIEIHGWEAGSSNAFSPDSASSDPEGLLNRKADKLIDNSVIINNDFAVSHNLQNVTIFLNQQQNTFISGIKIINDPDFGAKSFDVYASKAETPSDFKYLGGWSNILNSSDSSTEYEAFTKRDEYSVIKIIVTEFHNSQFLQINEIELLDQTETTENITRIMPLSASSIPDPYSLIHGTFKLSDNIKEFNSEFVVKNRGETVSLIFDLGSDKTINSVKHYNDGIYGALRFSAFYALSASPMDFIPTGSFDLTAQGYSPIKDDIVFAAPVKGRYIKFIYHSFSDPLWFQLNEIEFYSVGENLSITQIKPALINSSISEWPGFEASMLMDEKKEYNSDYAVKNSYTPVDILIDFESIQKFNRIDIFNDGEFGAQEVQIYCGNNETNLVQAAIFKDILYEPGICKQNIFEITNECRFIKLKFTKFYNPAWFQLNEIEIYHVETMESDNSYMPVMQEPVPCLLPNKTLFKPLFADFTDKPGKEAEVSEKFISKKEKSKQIIYFSCFPDSSKKKICNTLKKILPPDIADNFVFQPLNSENNPEQGLKNQPAHGLNNIKNLPPLVILDMSVLSTDQLGDQPLNQSLNQPLDQPLLTLPMLPHYSALIILSDTNRPAFFSAWLACLYKLKIDIFITNNFENSVLPDNFYKILVKGLVKEKCSKTPVNLNDIDFAVFNIINFMDIYETQNLCPNLRKLLEKIANTPNLSGISLKLNLEKDYKITILKELLILIDTLETFKDQLGPAETENIKNKLIMIINLCFN
jgi:hypothetical protein